MEVLKIKQADSGNVAETHIKGGVHNIGYIVIEKPIAIVHGKAQVDKEICNQYGYEVYESFNNGGTILASVGDIMFSHVGKIDNGWIFRFAHYFVEWLKAKGLNASHDNNDVLVDGYKVCGMCITRYGRIDFSSGFIGLTANLDHIKAICKKPMVKVPKGLVDYGISTEEVEQMLLDFCEQDKQPEEVEIPVIDPEERNISAREALEIILGGEV